MGTADASGGLPGRGIVGGQTNDVRGRGSTPGNRMLQSSGSRHVAHNSFASEPPGTLQVTNSGRNAWSPAGTRPDTAQSQQEAAIMGRNHSLPVLNASGATPPQQVAQAGERQNERGAVPVRVRNFSVTDLMG